MCYLVFWQLFHKSDISDIAFFSGRLANILFETLVACLLYTAAHFFCSIIYSQGSIYVNFTVMFEVTLSVAGWQIIFSDISGRF
jgi:hypothetical protein